MEAQTILARRSRFGTAWPLFEIFDNRLAEDMKIIRAFVDPIIEKAVERAVAKKGTANFETKEVLEGETLLDHLVKGTQGNPDCVFAPSRLLTCITNSFRHHPSSGRNPKHPSSWA